MAEISRGVGQESPNIQGVGLTDYDIYVMSGREKIGYILVAAVALFVAGLVFFAGFKFWNLMIQGKQIPYFNILLSLFLCPFAFLYPKIKTREIIKKRKKELNLQFKDMLYSLSSSLTAGKSVESSFNDVLKDLIIIYPNQDTFILREVEYMIRRLSMNETVETVLADFADRSHLEDVRNFVDVFYTCKRSGGNIVDIIRNTSNLISDKIEIKQEIDTILASRKFEQRVLNIMPIGMILVLSMSAGDFVEPVFTQPIGKVVMFFTIMLLIGAYIISNKIMDIKV